MSIQQHAEEVVKAIAEALQPFIGKMPIDCCALERLKLEVTQALPKDIPSEVLFLPHPTKPTSAIPGNFYTALLLAVGFHGLTPHPTAEDLAAGVYVSEHYGVFRWKDGELEITLPHPVDHIDVTIHLDGEN